MQVIFFLKYFISSTEPDQNVVAEETAVIWPRRGALERWPNNRVMGDEWA